MHRHACKRGFRPVFTEVVTLLRFDEWGMELWHSGMIAEGVKEARQVLDHENQVRITQAGSGRGYIPLDTLKIGNSGIYQIFAVGLRFLSVFPFGGCYRLNGDD